MHKNLEIIKKDKKWLVKEIKKQGFENPESIFLATVDINYKIKIYEYSEDLKTKDVLE
jgi:uncharacterized membrane protein YcaP (DUF421 family)